MALFDPLQSFQRKIYKDQAEQMLTTHVFPEFTSENGFLRARVTHGFL